MGSMMKKRRERSSEKRKYMRLNVETRIDLRAYDGDKSKDDIVPVAAMSKNISIDGIRFISDRELTPGSKMGVEIFLEDDADPVHIHGEVVWSEKIKTRKGADASYESGMRLLTIDKSDENRFIVYACDKMVESLGRHYHP